ncbi:hypothetical protein, partial [Brevibacillus brevis]|uniref:hypothetical protein n=1 Tax=Brevibacillus brevis TaxID=1393 RepID=UPI0037C9043A
TAFFGLNRIIEKERVSFTYTATKSGFLQDSPMGLAFFVSARSCIIRASFFDKCIGYETF